MYADWAGAASAGALRGTGDLGAGNPCAVRDSGDLPRRAVAVATLRPFHRAFLTGTICRFFLTNIVIAFRLLVFEL